MSTIKSFPASLVQQNIQTPTDAIVSATYPNVFVKFKHENHVINTIANRFDDGDSVLMPLEVARDKRLRVCQRACVHMYGVCVYVCRCGNTNLFAFSMSASQVQ